MITDKTINESDMTDEEFDAYLKIIWWERKNRHIIRQQCREEAEKFDQEFDEDFKKEHRRRFLESEIEALKSKILEREKKYIYYFKKKRPPLERLIIYGDTPLLKKKLEKLLFSLRVLDRPVNNSKNSVSDEEIRRAKDYDITRILEPNSAGFCNCPYHDDEHPSCWLKGNFGYCFACSKSFDTIELVQHLYGYNFVEAVKFLNK